MLIHNSKAFMRGLLLLVSFIAVFCVFFMKVFPGQHENAPKVTGLVYADNLFNTLSKGSSNFFDSTAAHKDSVEYRIRDVVGKQVEVVVPFKEKEAKLLPLLAEMTSKTGLKAEIEDSSLKVTGDLHAFLLHVTADSLNMYNNEASKVAERYGKKTDADGKKIMHAWWTLQKNMIKPLQHKGLNAEATAVNVVMTNAVESSYNFYGIEPLKVKDNIPLVTGFLIFYVVYTMWYGFAIFELFEGIGLTMSKSTSKQEV